MNLSSYTTLYYDYLHQAGLTLSTEATARIADQLRQTDWEQPRSAADCHNNAVMALIEAERTDDRTLRGMYLETAIALLEPFAKTNLLCAVHLMVIHSLIGETHLAIQQAFPQLIIHLQAIFTPAQPVILPQLIYLPLRWQSHLESAYLVLGEVLETTVSDRQIVLMLGEVLCQSQLMFYNAAGLRFLHLAYQLFPNSAALNLKLGISNLLNGQWEGVLYLHRAQQLQPHTPTLLQALYLAYRTFNDPAVADYWRAIAEATQSPDFAPAADWIAATDDASTLLPFQQRPFAVEPSLQSIVTSVLLAEGQWFEREMEFWCDQIQPGMTVIDVGANVGVYAIAAATQVGPTGRVLAIEPFWGCVQCLQETCRLNALDWVTVCQAAASDRDGTAQLGLHAISELNRLVPADAPVAAGVAAGEYQEVPCFRLDTLVEQQHLTAVDLLKIDAEGHELQVLMGSDRLLQQFAPIVLYENMAGKQGDNLPVAEWLNGRGYQLFRYQPYLKQLLPIGSEADLQGSLNIIALPANIGKG